MSNQISNEPVNISPNATPQNSPPDSYVKLADSHVQQSNSTTEQQPGKTAVIVVHGMGQQVRYETLNAVADVLLKADNNRQAEVKALSQGDQNIGHLELKLGPKKRDVHVYEAYWAPLTAGKISIPEVVRFLFDAGIQGIVNSLTPPIFKYNRWIFGKWSPVWFGWEVPLSFLTVVAVVTLLVILNLIIVGLAGYAIGITAKPIIDVSSIGLLTTHLGFIIIFAALFAAILKLQSDKPTSVEDAANSRPLKTLGSYLSVGCVLMMLMGCFLSISVGLPEKYQFGLDKVEKLILSAARLEWLEEIPKIAIQTGNLENYRLATPEEQAQAVSLNLNDVVATAPEIKREVHQMYSVRKKDLSVQLVNDNQNEPMNEPVYLVPAESTDKPEISKQNTNFMNSLREIAEHLNKKWLALTVAIWILAVATSLLLRWFVLEFVGDVAIYLSSYKVSKFNEVKQAILTTCSNLVRSVYSMKQQNGQFEYDRILLVAHSLGSVIAYDVLNQLITEDVLAGGCPNSISKRTKLFLTFGSPLDKVAFVFRTQISDEDQVKAALSASTQPLINNIALRPEQWVNIWSSWDIISGHLDNYDIAEYDQQNNPLAVRNIPDPDATAFLLAHNQYWQNREFRDILYKNSIAD